MLWYDILLYDMMYSGLSDVIDVELGAYHTCVIKTDGTMWCFGLNIWGEVGNGVATRDWYVGVATPHQIPGLTDVISMCMPNGVSCAALRNGTVWCWGKGDQGQKPERNHHRPACMHGC